MTESGRDQSPVQFAFIRIGGEVVMKDVQWYDHR